jgi:flagellar motor switch/type III secretory pathway protein FliN
LHERSSDVSDALLDPAELEAIQAAIREVSPRAPRRAARSDVEATRLALIADDRTAETARPRLLDLANRWVRPLSRTLKSHLPGTWQISAVGAEIIDGTIAREELRGGWLGSVAGPDGELVIAAHGNVIDAAAAKRCGATGLVPDTNRPPSAASLRLFQPAGRAILESWNVAWRELYGSDLAPQSDVAPVAKLIEARSLLRVALALSGEVGGRLTVYVRPEVLVQRPAAPAANKAKAAILANALANVQVEVVAELGTLRLRLSEIKKLARDATFTLQGFVDARVPVYCEGVLKAWARPVVFRGVIGLQIESVVHDQGVKS